MSDELTRQELELIRQWFDCVHDVNPNFLERQDYLLAKKIYELVGMSVPNSIRNRTD